MDLYQLRYFVETARQRSFTQAARRLEIAKPALSVQIQKLERELGARLFVRGQRQSVLTPAGEVLFEKAQELLSMADSVKQSVAEVSELRAGRLAVAFVSALGTNWLPDVFQRFRSEFPCVKLALEEEDSLGVAARVEDASAELGLLELPVNEQLFEIEKVWQEPVLAVLPQDHPLAGRSGLMLEELASEAFVVQRGVSYDQTLAACRQAGFEPRLACECSEKETAIALVQAGLGVLLLPQLAAAVPRQSLAVVPVTSPKLVRQFGLISHQARELSSAAKAFLELVKKIPFPRASDREAKKSKTEDQTTAANPAIISGDAAGSRPTGSLLTPLRFLSRSGQVHKDRLAIRYGQESLTYGEFRENVFRQASALVRAGLEPGDRVAWLCSNIPPLLEAHFGIPSAGGVLVPVNTRLTAGETAAILNHSGARFLFVDGEFASTVRPLRRHLETPPKIIEITGQRGKPLIGEMTYLEFLKSGSSKPLTERPKSEDDLISLNYTSGTTGKPKGVMISHRGAYINALGGVFHLGLSAASNLLWTLPMFHCNGWGLTWAATAAGATHTCLHRFDPAVVWKLIISEQVTHICGPPSMMAQLLKFPNSPARLNHSLTLLVGGAPPSADLFMQWEARGARVLHGYGLTESCGWYTLSEPDAMSADRTPSERARNLRRQGVPLVTGDTFRVVDERGRNVPRDGQTLGEVIMQGATVTSGYYKEPLATAHEFRDGWFHTGDLAVVHPDGGLELCDRRRDMIIVDGDHISSLEIEEVLNQHPDVAETAVVGVPDETRGETPKAFVVLKRGARLTSRKLIDFCRQHLAPFKCPTSVEVLRELPRTSSGKLQKVVLREREWAGYEKRIHGV